MNDQQNQTEAACGGSALTAELGSCARREIGKWLNEELTSQIDRTALTELCAAFDLLEAEVMTWRQVGRTLHDAGLRVVEAVPNA